MIPTYRAKKIDSSEWVEGYLIPLWTPLGKEQLYAIDDGTLYDGEGLSVNVYTVDPNDIEISFDGKEWRGIEYVKKCVENIEYAVENDGGY